MTTMCSVAINNVGTTAELLAAMRGITRRGFTICDATALDLDGGRVQLTLLVPRGTRFGDVLADLQHAGLAAD